MDLVTSILLRNASLRNFDKPTHFEESKRMKFLHHTDVPVHVTFVILFYDIYHFSEYDRGIILA